MKTLLLLFFLYPLAAYGSHSAVSGGGGAVSVGFGSHSRTSGASFSPALVSGLAAWYAADQQVYSDLGCSTPAANSGGVNCWKDLSGNGFDVTRTAGTGTNPSYAANAVNGKPAVAFSAVDGNQGLDTANTSGNSPLDCTTDCIFMLVVEFTALSTGVLDPNLYPFSKNFNAGTAPYANFCPNNGTQITPKMSTNGGNSNLGVAVNLNTFVLIEGWATGSTNTVYVNTVANTPHGFSGITPRAQGLTLGGYRFNYGGGNDLAGALSGEIAELVIYNQAVSAGDQTALRNYFNAKYALY